MFINPYVFFISLCVGIFLVYIFSSQPEIILKFPTPDTENDLIYQDKNDVCYKYKSKEVKCTENAKDIQLQDNNKDFLNIVKSTFN